MNLEMEKVKVIIEQCQFCEYWHIDNGCVYAGALDYEPIKDCGAYEKQEISKY